MPIPGAAGSATAPARWPAAPEPRGVGSVSQRETALTPLCPICTQRAVERGSTLQRHLPIDSIPCRPTVGTHQQPRICRKAGWVRLRGREPHGPEACLGRVGQDAQPRSCRVRRTAHTSKPRPSPMDVLAASLATGPTVPSHGMQALDVDVDVASAGAGRSPAAYSNPCSGTFASTRAQGNNGPGSRLRATISAGSSLAGTCSRSSWSCPAIRRSDG